MRQLTRRAFLIGAGSAAGWCGSSYLKADLPVLEGTHPTVAPTDSQFLNDASGLSRTPVHKHVTLGDASGDALVTAIRREMSAARAAGRAVNIGAARHSMGGQAIPHEGHALTLDNDWVEPDTGAGLYRVHAGARWNQVIAALDAIGYSPKVMQSNHDFGVAATYSVNAHGWAVPYGPMGATVRSVRMILPSGDWVNCSRHENAELFALAMGGYGLIGAITDMDVEMVPNQRLEASFEQMPAEQFSQAFMNAIRSEGVNMAYGRLNVGRARFFDEALLITYRPSADQSALPAASGSGAVSQMASYLYRWQLGNEPVKRLRWWTESILGPTLNGAAVTRNSLINEPVATLDDRNPDRTDILHEYFVAPERFNEFLEVCRQVIPASYQEFLNVTLRFVGQDTDSVLNYATTPRIAAVMSFSQEMTLRGEADMQRMTRALVDRVIDLGGAYYLPYRPHQTPEQLARCYRRASEFTRLKRDLDPDLIFRNNLWDSYLAAL